MSDHISRDEAMFCLTGEIKPKMTIEDYIERVLGRLRDLPSVDTCIPWVSMKDRFPPDNKLVLVTVETQKKLLVRTDYFDEEDCTFDDWGKDVIAWAPLPEAYQGR